MKKPSFFVGVGASAGGLEACIEFFKAFPKDANMTFILVQHLEPSHESILSEILSRHTPLVVAEAKNNAVMLPHHVYVIPPDKNVIVSHDFLKITPRKKDKNSRYLPVDILFYSLAKYKERKAVGVVLSGTGSDGTLGIKAIKAAGGMTFAQDKNTAKYSDMPVSAKASGCIDFVLAPQEMAQKLLEISRHPTLAKIPLKKEKIALNDKGEPTDKIFALLQDMTGVDFSHYKHATIGRRIARRMMMRNVEKIADYFKLLENDSAECKELYCDLLISVTSFFRDPAVFKSITKKILSHVLSDKSLKEPIRIWVPGCSTGEEAYSLAMSLYGLLEKAKRARSVVIFGTDLSDACIGKARVGIYPQDIRACMPPKFLRRFFTKIDKGYKISKVIRDMCIFAKQNITKDPPLSNMDVISCRNLLIYLDNVLQDRVMVMLHYALNPGGFLVLGTSESLGSVRDLFEPIDTKNKIYRKGGGVSQSKFLAHKISLEKKGKVLAKEPCVEKKQKALKVFNFESEINNALLLKYAPVVVVVNSELEIIHFRGYTSPYLEHISGKASLNLLNMAREGLLLELPLAIQQALKKNAIVRREGLVVVYGNKKRNVNFEVMPLKDSSAKEKYVAIFFEEDTVASDGKEDVRKHHKGKDEIETYSHTRLKKELFAVKTHLQAIIEDKEAANEELKAANEEIQSSNEELQSMNEELETAKEELQSSNEELSTLNEELQNKNIELNQLNSDLTNIFSSISVPFVLVDNELKIRRMTSTTKKVMNIIPTDIGRLLSDIKLKINVPNLESLVSDVIETMRIKEMEIQDNDGFWYALCIRPYKTVDNKIDGAVLSFFDIDSVKRSQLNLNNALKYSDAIIKTMRESLVVLDDHLQVLSANESFYHLFQTTPKQAEGRHLYELNHKDWDIPELRHLLDKIVSGDVAFDNFEIKREFARIGLRTMLLNARRVIQEGQKSVLILLAIEDITERKKVEEALAKVAKTKSDFTSMVSHELRTPLAALKEAISLVSEGLEGTINDKQKEILNIADNNLVRLAKFINHVLDFQKLDAGKMEFHVEVSDINTTIKEAVDTMSSFVQKKGLSLILELDEQLPKIKFDHDRIIDVLLNLVGNSIKFTEKGSITIATKLSGNSIQVSVKDTGLGIQEKDMKRLFQQYEQLERKAGGTGLGLAIAQQVIAAHGGKIWAESIFGQGATFHFVLPIKEHKEGKNGKKHINRG